MAKFFRNYCVEIFMFLLFICYACILNKQFTDGSNINYTFSGHDEYLTIREVYSILEPADFKHFAMGVSAGDILFYGRVVFYTDALAAFIPYKIWGLPGLVFAVRMFHVLCLFFGIVLLARTFLKSRLASIVFYISTLSLYYTAYFVMIPKPEPLQLLFLAVFLHFAVKREWGFGRHFIWLGLAYGTKFNVLMILPLLFLLPAFIKKFNLKSFVFSGISFLLGLVIAIPALLLGLFKPQFLKSYIGATFLNTEHYDDTNATAVDWLKEGFFNWYSGHFIVGAIVFVVFLFFIARGVLIYFKEKKVSDGFIAVLIALCLLIPVMLLTKRMWAHYLWTGYVFFSLGLLAYAELPDWKALNRKILTYGLCLLFVVSAVLSLNKVRPLAGLEKDVEAVKTNAQQAYAYLRKKSGHFVAVQDITVYMPFEDHVKNARYHPFQTAYPYPVPDQKFSWIPFINPENIAKIKADYILTYKFNFEQNISGTVSAKDIIVRNSYEKMQQELNKTIFPDTVFGVIRVYRVAK